jgi:hypothetical protein
LRPSVILSPSFPVILREPFAHVILREPFAHVILREPFAHVILSAAKNLIRLRVNSAKNPETLRYR